MRGDSDVCPGRRVTRCSRACLVWARRCWFVPSGQALDLSFSRIQFTPDLMPADITGTSLSREDGELRSADLPVSARAAVRQPGARRRDQPRHAQDPIGAAGGDAGAAASPLARPATHLARAVLRAGDPEPDRDGGHLPAARGAARSVLVQARRCRIRARTTCCASPSAPPPATCPTPAASPMGRRCWR